jgi:membrane associated rhomboid family serine protease
VLIDASLQFDVIGETSYQRMEPLKAFLHFSTYHFFRLEVWRLLGFQFLHADLTHLLFNMLGLYFFGGLVEGYLGPRRYLAFYLTCGVFGAVAYLFLNLFGNILPPGYRIPGLLFNDIHTPLIGASAGVFGVLMAAAFIAPAAQVLLFFVIPMRLATMAYLLTLFAAYVVITGGQNAGGQAAHLGGAAAGFYFIRHTHLLRDFFDILGPPRKKAEGPPRTRLFGPRPPTEAELDRILDKIRAQGLQSLTESERRTLRQGTEGKRRGAH